ncbi:MAG: DEAD/DEAH box helicase family protein [Cytophagales bacterium]|nr:DEAD/DEAH box helicase family protein [Cytophagales bacterium]
MWHTTGSGKTLTSFKVSTLLKDNPDIEKCLFVVDRKDLDRQTREEFNKFQDGCVEENTNTETLHSFADSIMSRMIFDGEKLADLLAPRELGWKDRTKAELALMEDLLPLLKKLAQGRDISGLAAYEQ